MRSKLSEERANVAVVYPCVALRGPYSGCFVDSGMEWLMGNGACGGEEETPKIINPSPILLREGVLLPLVVRSSRW